MTESSSTRRRWLLWAIRLLILAAVVAGVSGTFHAAAAHLADHEWRLRPAWLAASGAAYIAGLAAMAWFWRRALAALGQPVPWPPSLRAYYLGHLGKYAAVKALVVVLRVGAIRPLIRSVWLTVVSTLLETMIMMAVGASLAAVLASVSLRLETRLTILAAASAVLIILPTLPPIVRRIARRGLLRFRLPSGDSMNFAPTAAELDQAVERVTWQLWATGVLASAVCWILLGLSLWAALRAIGIDDLEPLADLPLFVGAVSLAVVGGFVSLLPGGLVVRDALLMQILAPVCGEANALVAAVLLRIVWLVSEVVACGILYGADYLGRPSPP
jgi:uncharacterized membrane protein YbhN (UPF0104 family)